MRFTLLRKISPSVRARLWMVYLGLGFLLVCMALVLTALTSLTLSSSHMETIRSFHPAGIGFTALSAMMIGGFWLYHGFSRAFRQLSRWDYETSERLRTLFLARDPIPQFSLVALGGGTGLSSLLKGLKELPVQLTAVVTVTDDGGSSGRLRQDLQILPPGDIRNCLVALSRAESLLSQLFQFRFEGTGPMSGHSFGNLFIAAMTSVLGDFGSAVREASNILAIRGTVVPVTGENVQLSATFDDESTVTGETAIAEADKRIIAINLEPKNPTANPEALSAIDDAHMVVLGPGSLFTSVIPNLLVPGLAARIGDSAAQVVYVCNVMTQRGETDQFTAYDHVRALLEQTPLPRLDTVIVNARRSSRVLMEKYEARRQFWVPPTVAKIESMGIRVISGDFLQDADLLRHNPVSLATVLLGLLNERVGKLRQPGIAAADFDD